ncbi:MAG: MoaD/ThiS family protein [Candidatus Poribacteria bacterium]|uniref:Molybdopterin synthase sulfur carrier subunit n=1 Tax=marine metagenome TaxID=408172 RepID=A0A381VKL7_9ZZZZ|nr:MoaD/ThiS family protein [Candidatus Poribacteria bacterium]MEE3195257.1 MoaD/ThiS family protein [Candidatus Poribacteria bacterium]|tara:strand:- start:112 stop:414 length:303 start_codon:yes stop_codon:yes gene_type:complete
MSVIVRIPTPLRKLTQNKPEVEVSGKNIESLIDNLEANYPGIKERIYDEANNIRRFVNIYLNDEDIRFLEGKSTAVNDGDEVSIIPAIAGGILNSSQLGK